MPNITDTWKAVGTRLDKLAAHETTRQSMWDIITQGCVADTIKAGYNIAADPNVLVYPTQIRDHNKLYCRYCHGISTTPNDSCPNCGAPRSW